MTRTSLRVIAVLGFFLLRVGLHGASPNVLFIIVDDLRPELGCYGVEEVRTPHIDRFAKEALLFERAYCQQAACMSSRHSLLSGFRPDTRKIWTNRDVRKSLQDIDFLPAHFRRHGYHTVGIGKVAHNNWEDPRCWSEPHRMPKNGAYEYRTPAGRALVEKMQREAAAAGRPDPFAKIPEKIRRGMPWESLDVADNELGDGQIADTALKALDRLQDRPFFLAVGFLRPHLPFVAPKRYWDLYDPDKLPTPETTSPPKGAPALANNRSSELLRQYRGLPSRLPLNPELSKQLVHGYYACVSYIDAQIGRVLDGLKQRGLSENTIVVVTSDHGFQLGDLGMWCKATNFELSTRVPLLIRTPGMTAGGKKTTSLVELVGLYPTLCDIVGLPKPDHLQGNSFAALLGEPDLTLRKTAVSQYYRGSAMGHSIRTTGFRYTEWRERENGKLLHRELYDHRTHSREDVNLAAQPNLADQVKELSKLLKRGRLEGTYD